MNRIIYIIDGIILHGKYKVIISIVDSIIYLELIVLVNSPCFYWNVGL